MKQDAIDFCDNEIKEWQAQKEVYEQVDTTGLDPEWEALFWSNECSDAPWRKSATRLSFLQKKIGIYLKAQKLRNG